MTSQTLETLAEACRVETDPTTGEMFIVFKITSERFKRVVAQEWHRSDIEYRIVDKKLIRNE